MGNEARSLAFRAVATEAEPALRAPVRDVLPPEVKPAEILAAQRRPVTAIEPPSNKPQKVDDFRSFHLPPERVSHDPALLGKPLPLVPEKLADRRVDEKIVNFLRLPDEGAAATVDAIRRLRPDQVANLGEDERRRMLHAFATMGRLGKERVETLAAVLIAAEDDPAFLADDGKRTVRLIEFLKADPTVQWAAANWWNGGSKDENVADANRRTAFVRIVESLSQLYGIQDPPKVVFQSLRSDVFAKFEPSDNSIRIDPFTDKFRYGHAARKSTIIHTTIEEVVHAYQWHLAWAYISGALDRADPRYRQAELFALNVYAEVPNSMPEAHNRQPNERHAKRVIEAARAGFKFDAR